MTKFEFMKKCGNLCAVIPLCFIREFVTRYFAGLRVIVLISSVSGRNWTLAHSPATLQSTFGSTRIRNNTHERESPNPLAASKLYRWC